LSHIGTILSRRQISAEKLIKGPKMETQNGDTQAPQSTKGESSESPFKEAYSLLNKGRLEDAIQFLEEKAPCWEQANLLGCCYAMRMNFSKAEDAFFEALHQDLENSETMYNLAFLYNEFFQPNKAKKYLEMYFRHKQYDAADLYFYALVLLELNLHNEAYEVLKKSYKMNSTDVFVISNLAIIILDKKMRPRVALRLLKKAAEIKPVDPDVLFTLAKVAWDVGEELTCFNAREMLHLIDPEMCAELDERTGRQSWI
jgi:tetratricopeptide (TPR) repeat protein